MSIDREWNWNLKVERYLLVKLKFSCNSMSYQATEGSAVKQRARAIHQPSLKFECSSNDSFWVRVIQDKLVYFNNQGIKVPMN